MRLRARGALSVLLAALGSTANARAESKSSAPPAVVEVELDATACPAIASDELRRIVGAELGPEVVVVARAPGAAAAEKARTDVAVVTVACDQRLARLEVLDPLSGKRLVRHVDLERYAAGARSRVLGVAIAELLAASWIELTSHARGSVRPVEARASESSRVVARDVAEKTYRPPSAWALEPSLAVRQVSDAELSAYGGGVGFSRVQWGWLVLGGDLAIESGNARVSSGSIDALLVSAGASLRLRQELDVFRFEAGIGARYGIVHFRGVPGEEGDPPPHGQKATLPWAGPFAAVRAGLALGARTELCGRFEAGFATLAAEALVSGQPELVIEREWLGFGLGVGFLFDG
jgi:hypothetical protein